VPGVWGLPADTSNDIVYPIADSIPIYDELCRIRLKDLLIVCIQL